MTLLALDIGGANLKAADGRGFAVSRPFPLWQRPAELATALAELLAASPPADKLVVTMTGELADCFDTKADGVHQILTSAQQAAGGKEVLTYLSDGSLVAIEAARRQPLLAAASNWHALARFASRFCSGKTGLVIDICSTTTVLIPIIDGQPAAAGTNDTERLASGELVYTGVERSPICAVVDSLPWRDRQVPVAQEVFATTRDAYLLLGDLSEDTDDRQTANGRPATRKAARDRLARMICADCDTYTDDDAMLSAGAVTRTQLSKLGIAARGVLRRLPEPPSNVVLSGQGEFLARRLCERLQLSATLVSLSDTLGASISRVAPAHALAVIARELL
jgi:probable H4MPT-linked C1 transfer pathway protein